MGRRQAKQGNRFQDSVSNMGTYAEAQGRLVLVEVPQPTKTLKGGEIRRTAPVYADFFGVCRGVMFGFDAKSVEHESRFEFSHVRPIQRDRLAATAKHGGIAFLLVHRRIKTPPLGQELYAFPIDADGVIAETTDRKSIRWDDALQYRIEWPNTWVDYIETEVEERSG